MNNADAVVEHARQVFLSCHHWSETMVIAVGDYYFGKVPEILIRAACPLAGGRLLLRGDVRIAQRRSDDRRRAAGPRVG